NMDGSTGIGARALCLGVATAALTIANAVPAAADLITLTLQDPMLAKNKTGTATVNYLYFNLKGGQVQIGNAQAGTAIPGGPGLENMGNVDPAGTLKKKQTDLVAQMKADVQPLAPAPTVTAVGNSQITIKGLTKVTKNGPFNLQPVVAGQPP